MKIKKDSNHNCLQYLFIAFNRDEIAGVNINIVVEFVFFRCHQTVKSFDFIPLDFSW